MLLLTYVQAVQCTEGTSRTNWVRRRTSCECSSRPALTQGRGSRRRACYFDELISVSLSGERTSSPSEARTTAKRNVKVLHLLSVIMPPPVGKGK